MPVKSSFLWQDCRIIAQRYFSALPKKLTIWECYNPSNMADLHIPIDAKPVLNSRRNEFIAWLFSVVLLVAVLVTSRNRIELYTWFYIGVALVSLAAVVLSLNNWIERNTLLRIDQQGVAYASPLRSLALGWEQIEKMRVVRSVLNKKIYVFGERSFFSFHTLAEGKVGGRVKARMGFAEGEQILQIILERAKLTLMEQQDGSAYYARG